ncbi:MAG: DUF4317 family protein, partial [Oscillospiraceae bacterium]|nr:DUF4317 family protein [Oscillospiraceae bacterium]
IYGCYVNDRKEIISEFKQSTGIMPENEAEKYFGLLKRTLSGSSSPSASHRLCFPLRLPLRAVQCST